MGGGGSRGFWLRIYEKKANYGITALWKGLENQIYMIFAYMI